MLLIKKYDQEPGSSEEVDLNQTKIFFVFTEHTEYIVYLSTWSMPGRALLKRVLVSMCSGTNLHPTAGISDHR